MYEEYFGLDRPPFKITPDTSLFFKGGKRGDILDALVYATHRGEGIIKVVGEVGSGKTMLCRMLQLKLPDSVEIVYIANPSVSPEDILFVIAHELSLAVTRDASKHEVMHQLHDYLLQRHMEDKQVVLFVEEAQGMPLDTLEEIRLLSNLETDQNKLLQIILFGQPELDQNLAKQSIRQLRERITHNFELDPLTPEEIHNYLNFRMRQVGYTGPELINKSVAKKIEQHSAGLLRRINIIADKLLLSAFAEGTHNLGTKHVTAAVNDSTFNDKVRSRSGLMPWLGLFVIAAVAFGLYQSRPLWLAWVQPDTAEQIVLTAELDEPVAETVRQPVESTAKVEAPLVESEVAEAEPLVRQAPIVEITDVELEADPEEISAIEADELSGLEEAVETNPKPVEQVLMQIQASRESELPAVPATTEETVTEPVQTLEIVRLPEDMDSVEQTEFAEALADRPRAEVFAEAPVETVEWAISDSAVDYEEWLVTKLRESKEWLRQAPRNNVSIQVMMRNKSAERELVEYLRNDWPLDLSKTYLYEVSYYDRKVYRVFYNEFNTMTVGRHHIERLPESVKSNSPYLDSVHRMRKALL